MYKLLFVLLVSVLVAEGMPFLAEELVQSAQNGDWDRFHALIDQQKALAEWALNLSANTAGLQPNEGRRSFGSHHFITIIKEWSDEGDSEHSEGEKVVNNNANVPVNYIQV